MILLGGTEEPGFGDEEDSVAVAVTESPLMLVGGAELDTPPDVATPVTLGLPPPDT